MIANFISVLLNCLCDPQIIGSSVVVDLCPLFMFIKTLSGDIGEFAYMDRDVFKKPYKMYINVRFRNEINVKIGKSKELVYFRRKNFVR